MKKKETLFSVFHPDVNIYQKNKHNASDKSDCVFTSSAESYNEDQATCKRITETSQKFNQDVGSNSSLPYSSSEITTNLSENYNSQTSPHSNNEFSLSKSSCKEFSEIKNFTGSPSQVLSFSDTRAKIEEISDHCVEEFLRKRKMFIEIYEDYQLRNRKNHSDLFVDHLKNLDLQNKEFGKFVSSSKTQFMINSTENKCIYTDSIIKGLYMEASIFLNYFPAYSVREKVIKEVEANQVTIISANCSYHFNIALPLILSNEYKDHTIISCEESDILRTSVQAMINSIFSSTHLTLPNLKLMTREELFNEFISFSSSESNFIIIYNVPLKRSLTTDINLANLRDLLVRRKKIKLILLITPYNDSSKFKLFFSPNAPVSVLNFPSLCFPVKTIWKEALTSPSDDFREDISSTILAIHVLCEPGDIIVFIPSVKDVRFIHEELDVKIHHHQYSEIKVYCIDDNYNDFLKLSKNFHLERRVFLLTSGCEGIINPLIRYVIDCGIHEEYLFDSKLDNNISTPTYISQARAQIRKELAGAFNMGTCFRLYNKSNFLQDMNLKEHPELFYSNPVHSMINIIRMLYYPYNGEIIEFVESLSSDVQKSTLEMLRSYNAFDKNNRVTPFWEQVVKLPLPIKHSRLLLYGLRWGYAFEAVVLVAFFSIRKKLFVKSENEGQQKLIDMTRLDFSQSNSDTLTYLNIFKMWKENGFKKLWCINHFINFDVLKSIRYKVNDLCYIINEKLGEEITQDFSDDKDPNDLIQMLFECFQNNLCSYTGHHRIGYHNLASKQFVFVHPSSFLYQRDYPRFVVYEDLIYLDSDHILNLTCIPPDIVMKYFGNGKLKFDVNEIFEDQLVERVIDSVGEKVMKQIFLANNGKKTREIENNIKTETGTEVILLDPILEKGCVNVYAFPDDIQNCITSLNNILKHCIERMLKEEEFKVIEFTKGENTVQLETKWTKGAETVSCEHVFLTVNSAPNFNQSDSSDARLSSECNQTSINYILKLVWQRRFCADEGYLNVKCANDFIQARRLAMRTFVVDGKEIFVQLSERKPNQLRLSGISREMTKEDLIRTFSYCLSFDFEIELYYDRPFKTSASEIFNMKKQIEENCRDKTNICNFKVKILEPKPTSEFMNAYIHVFEARCLDREAENLSRTKVNNIKLSCTPLYCSDLKCSRSIYDALFYRIKTDLENFKHEYTTEEKDFNFNVNITDDSVSLKFSSNDIEIVKLLQMRMNDLLCGIVLDKNNVENIPRIFCHGGHVHLKNLESSKKILIVQNFETKTIRLYGKEEDCNFVREAICNFLNDVEELTEEILLSNRTVLKALITQYGVNLETFIELNGLRSAALDIKTSVLIVYGRRENIDKAIECIKDLSSATDSTSDVCSITSGEICPVCACVAENLTVRLEHCGHVYCFGCIEALIQQAKFPLQCCAENCSKDIILEDIKYVLNYDARKIDELAEMSLKTYLEKNREIIFYCPAPDCTMFVYKNELEQNGRNEDKWNCPLCKNSICIKCKVIYHEGFTCDIYQGSRNDPDYSFKVWQRNRTRDCKSCPNCASAIEKRDGCNHMTCSVCSCHFCWICLQQYKTGNEVYDHIGRAHPGLLFAR